MQVPSENNSEHPYAANFRVSVMYANPVNFLFVWVPVTGDKVVKVQEPLPNHLIKQYFGLIQ